MKKIYFLLFTLSFLVINAQSPMLNFANDVASSGTDEGRGVVVDPSGNVYSIGFFSGSADFDPSAGSASLTPVGGEDIYVVKYNSAGQYQWAFNVGSSTDDRGFSIAVDASSNIYITGKFTGTNVDFDPSSGTTNLSSLGAEDIFVAKYDGTLNPSNTSFIKWAFNIGSSSDDHGNAITVDANGFVYLTGFFMGTADFDPSANTNNQTIVTIQDVFVAKYDGNLLPSNTSFYQWAFRLGSTGDDVGNGIAVDAAGNVYVTGKFAASIDFDPSSGTNTFGTVAFSDVFVAKYDGTLLPTSTSFHKWAFRIGGSQDDAGHNIKVDGSGNVYVTGFYKVTSDFDPSANTANVLTVGGSDDAFIAKYNGNLVPSNTSFYQWAFNIGGSSFDYAYGINLDVLGNIYVTGFFLFNVDFDPSSGVTSLTSNSSSPDVFVAKYDANLTPSNTSFFKWVFPIGSTGDDRGYAVSNNSNENVFIAGKYSANADFDPMSGVKNLPVIGGSEGFSGKYCQVPFAPVNITSASNATICSGFTTTLTVTTQSLSTVSWFATSTSTTVLGTGTLYATPTLTTGATATTYTFYAEAQTCTVSANRTPVTVTVYPLPNVTISGNNYVCAGYSTVLTGNGASTYSWSTSATTQTISVAPSSATDYTVIGTDALGCKNQAVQNVSISPLPVVSITSPTNTACSGYTTILTGNGANTYTWSTSVTTPTAAVSPTTTTSYTVTGTDTKGCINTATFNLTVISLPVVTINGPTVAACAGTTITLTAGGANTYTWNTSATTAIINPAPSVNTNYTVTGTGSNGCNNTAVYSATVHPLPTISVTSTHTLLCTQPLQQTATLTPSGGLSYTWSPAIPLTGEISPSVTTSYTLTGADVNGCVNTFVFTQSVSICSGIDEQTTSLPQFAVHPNPGNGIYYVSATGVQNANVKAEIFNSIGQSILTKEISQNTFELNLSGFANGIYYIRLINSDKVIFTSKIIKE